MFSKILIYLTIIPIIITNKTTDDEIFEAMKKGYEEVGKIALRQRQLSSNKTSVCYEEIGCFTIDGPLKHIRLLPLSIEKLDTKFMVYVKNRFDFKEIKIMDNNSYSVIPKNINLAVLIHGFGENVFGNNGLEDIQSLKDSLIQHGNIPVVIIVDWHIGSEMPYYPLAVVNSQVIGRQIALLTNRLIQLRDISPKNVHLIGFNLGAHVAGFAGKFSINQYNWSFERITGLDPDGDLFEDFPGSHLTKEDALFVDVIHTNGGINKQSRAGISMPVGHLDFYPNGGQIQPRCKNVQHISCNHYSAAVYMDASLSAAMKCPFWGIQCDTYENFTSGKCGRNRADSRMGFWSFTLPAKGKRFLNTIQYYPYCHESDQ